MKNEQLTFNDLPQVVAELRDEVSGMKALLLNLQNRPTQQRENRHRFVWLVCGWLFHQDPVRYKKECQWYCNRHRGYGLQHRGGHGARL